MIQFSCTCTLLRCQVLKWLVTFCWWFW